MPHSKTGWLIVSGLVLAPWPAQAQNAAACTVSAPVGWTQSAVRWDGPCPAGSADGLGVLKELGEGGVRRMFFGLVKNGEVKSGVIDEGHGYVAGDFAHGAVLGADGRQTAIHAFMEAAEAAEQAAQRFEKVGNPPSAQFYRARAKALREQMD